MTARRSKSLSLVLSIVLAGLALLSWTQNWFTVVLSGQPDGHPALLAGGDVSAPALSALAVATLAATGALSIAGRVFRVILATLQLILGGCIALSAILALSAPTSAVEPVVTTSTGVAGDSAVASLISSVTASAWPFVALVSGILLVVVSVWILATGHRWPNSGRKYQAVRFESVDGADSGGLAISDWDALSGGEDPTGQDVDMHTAKDTPKDTVDDTGPASDREQSPSG